MRDTVHAEEPFKASIDVLSMTMSVVVCCHSIERIDEVRECVYSVLDQTWPLCEVILAVDHNDELFDKLRGELPELVKVVANTGIKGLSDTRNAGISHATGDVIGFIDDDAAAARDWVERLMDQYRVRSVVGVGGRSVPVWANGRPSWFAEELDWIVGSTYKGAPEVVEQVVRLIGCNMSFRREAFEIAGVFSTELGRVDSSGEGEDSEICYRIRERIRGSLLLYEPKAVVYHKVPPHRATFKYLLSRSYSGGLAVASLGKMYRASEEEDVATTVERSYLRYLLTSGLLERLRYAYRRPVMGQIVAILASIAATGAGYTRGRTRKRKTRRVPQ
jgi:glycosyltransferase involved in cell wall biosynthesis